MTIMENTNDNVNDMEVLKKMEDEHLRLQRQFRTTQTDRLHRTMGVHPLYRKQDKLLRTLKAEYVNISKDLKIATSGAHKSKRERLEGNLQKALLQRVKTQAECEEGVTIMDQLDGVLRRNNKEMLALRKMVTANMGEIEKRKQQSEYRLVSTENKLETAMLRFNAVQCENQRIREEIEHMLKDRSTFNQAWTKMMAALNKGKKFLTDLFESTTLAYDQRDEWCAKLHSIQEKAKMDQMQQVQEMRDLQKAYDHEMRMYNFLAKKGIMRVNKHQEEREEEERLKEENDQRKQYEDHMEILYQIYEYTNETDPNKIIDLFKWKEYRNFSIYLLLTDFCAENVVLEKSLRSIRQEIEDRRDWNEMKEARAISNIQKWQQELEEKQKRTQELRDKLEEKNQMLHRTMEKIDEIFKMLDCSLEPFENLLGDKQPSLWQLNLTLQLIADKIKSHIYTVYYYEHNLQKKKEHSSMSRLKKYTIHPTLPEYWTAASIDELVPATPCPSCVEARWMSRMTEQLEAPLSAEAARAALKGLVAETAYLRSDRIHQLTECRVPRSRAILARRYMNF